jgi:hypothetical protein
MMIASSIRAFSLPRRQEPAQGREDRTDRDQWPAWGLISTRRRRPLPGLLGAACLRGAGRKTLNGARHMPRSPGSFASRACSALGS